jgi:predicted lipid-binding transport protein (Tim44 family)
MKKRKVWAGIGLLSTIMWMACATIDLAEARAGRGGSMGSRGSYSSSAPRQTFSPPSRSQQTATSPNTVSPGRPQRPGTATPTPPSTFGSFGRGLAGGLAGGLIGGMVGNMLFGSSSHAGAAGAPMGRGGCNSIGLFDLIIIGGLLYLGYRMLRRRQEAFQASNLEGNAMCLPTSWQTVEPTPASSPGFDLKKELEPIRWTDPSFNENSFKEMAQDIFFKIQGAWMRQDPTLIKDLATPELAAILEKDLQELKTKAQINKLENIAVRQVDISEAWQEQGLDYITVGFLANLLDYTVDAKTNLLMAGSDTEPVKFEEYWTFTRLTGSTSWKLSGITQPQV